MTKEEWLVNANTPLQDFEKLNWRGILVVEDILVAAMAKSLEMAQAPTLGNVVTRQAVRDVMGELIGWLTLAGRGAVADGLREALASHGDGSGDGTNKSGPNP